MGRVRNDNYNIRKSELKDPENVFLLACEGRHTERRYFLGIQDNKQYLKIADYLQIEIFSKSHQDISHPLKIFEELKDRAEQIGLEADEICIIADRDSDSVTPEQYTKLLDGCKKNEYSLFLSNPNFELWLLFHFLDRLSPEKKDIYMASKGEAENDLQEILYSRKLSRSTTFNKKIDFNHYKDHIDTAINNAKSHEYDLNNLKDNLGTNVFQLVEKLKRS